jgi:putative PIG3 family NAD(P)H quinone oxidoreductase
LATVHAIVITHPGGPDVLSWTEVPDPPSPVADEVLVDVRATAVNRADLLQRAGHYDPPPGASPYPGLECSGVVAAVGANVTDHRWQPGEPVLALLSGGGYAERVVVPAGQLMPIPAGVDPVDGAGLPEVVCTVWSNVFMLAALQPAETLLVHGGASGIGTMAIQLAKAVGARALVTAGSPAKLARCAELGADAGIDYHQEDFVERVLALTDGRGVDVILDSIGAAYLDRNLRCLATSGRLAVIGMQGGTKAELDLSRLMARRAAVLATSLRARPSDEKAAIIRSVVENVWPLVGAGTIRPVIDRVLPIEHAGEAHRIVEAGEHVGKVVLRVR